MRVTLIEPRFRHHVLHPPLGLGYIASVLEVAGHQVELIDCNLDHLTDTEVLDEIEKNRPALIGISIMTGSYHSAKNLVHKIKARTEAPVVVGGVHVTSLPIHSIEDTGADYAVIGEGEYTMKDLCASLENGDPPLNEVKGLAIKEGSEVRINEPRELIGDIDSLPMPAWHLMPPKRYHIAPVLASTDRYPVAPIMSTRGCPYRCKYCASHVTWRRKLRARDPKKVVDEIEYLVKEFGVREIHFADDNLTFSENHARAICNELINRNLEVSWGCPNGVRIDKLSPDLIKLMRKAGCNMMGFGLESGSQEILNNISKRLDLSIVPPVLTAVKKEGITTFGFFVIGLPGETKETLRKTIDFSKSLPLDRAWFFIFAPLPGSELFEEWAKDRDLSNIRWEELDTYTGIVESTELTKEDLEAFQRRAVWEFYLRPRIIFNVLRKMRYENYKTLLTWLKNRVGPRKRSEHIFSEVRS